MYWYDYVVFFDSQPEVVNMIGLVGDARKDNFGDALIFAIYTQYLESVGRNSS